MSLQTEISSCQGKQVSTLGNDLNTNISIVFMKGIMRAELMGRQNEMLGLTSRQKVSTWKI
jgi:hypothetical protein